jgi:hypothetical protein
VIVTLNPSEVEIASYVGMRRRLGAMQRGLQELYGASRADAATQWYYNIVGACGEMAVAKATNNYWGASIVPQRKGEPDVGTDIQVRCLAGNDYDLIVRTDDLSHFRYFLCLGEPPTFKIAGWMWGGDAKQDKWFKDRGGRGKPCYWVPQSELVPPDVNPRELSVATP